MKRKLVTLTLVLSMCSVPVYADDAATVESVLQGMQEYSANTASEAATMNMNLDAALKIASEEAPETSIPIVMTGNFDMKVIQDPMQIAMTGAFKMTAMGQAEDMSMDMYMTMSEDGKADTYVNAVAEGEESGWQHSSVDMEEMLSAFGASSMEELSSKSFEDLLGVDLDWTLTEADDAYTLETTFAYSDMMPVIEASMQAAGEVADEEEMAMAEEILSAFKMNMSYVIDKDTYATRSCHIDFNDSDLTAINDMIAEAMGSALDSEENSAEISFALNDFSIDMEFSYETVESIEIPEEALNAETVDVNELAEEAVEAVE